MDFPFLAYLRAVFSGWWNLVLAVLTINEVSQLVGGRSFKLLHRYRVPVLVGLLALAQASAWNDMRSEAEKNKTELVAVSAQNVTLKQEQDRQQQRVQALESALAAKTEEASRLQQQTGGRMGASSHSKADRRVHRRGGCMAARVFCHLEVESYAGAA